jgi:hypothetical protein
MSIAVLCLALAQALTIERPTTSKRCWVGQAVELRAGFALPAAALERGLVQVFQQPLDVPVAFDVPWWDGLDGLEPLGPAAPVGDTASLVLNGAVARFGRGTRTELDGSTGASFGLERSYVALRAGELVLAPSTLRGTHATRFAEDLVLGARALDGQPFELRGPAVSLHALELPEADRPTEFRGAIGEFTVRQALSSAEVDAGAELRLSIEVEGRGNHGRFALAEPQLPAGLRRLGSLPSVESGRTRLDVSIRAEQTGEHELPAYVLSHFDPLHERYATANSGGQRLRVLALAAPVEAGIEEVGHGRWMWPATGLFGLVLCTVLFAARRRRPSS